MAEKIPGESETIRPEAKEKGTASMKITKYAAVLVSAVLFGLLPANASARAEAQKEAECLEDCIRVLKEITAIPEKGIPPALLGEAEAIAIIPSVYKAGFVVGGRYGKGVVAVRDERGNWKNPFFITLAGGSLGWQIGVQSTDLILVFKNRRNVEDIKNGKFTLGGDAAVAAGPVGRKAEAATDIKLKSEIYSYSRSRGLFAGISLEGAVLQVDHTATWNLYELPLSEAETAENIPEVARQFKQALRQHLP